MKQRTTTLTAAALDQGGRGRGGGRGRFENRGGGEGRGNRGGGRSQEGRGGGGRGFRGGGGRGERAPDLRNLSEVMTNIINCDVSESISFYQYNVESMDAGGNLVESRGRRGNLFRVGLWDTILADMDPNEKEELKRLVYFTGSYFFSARPIPGLEKANLPREMVSGAETGGDSMTCVGVDHFGPPACLVPPAPPVPATNVRFDNFRCSDCTRTFATREALLQHCNNSNHSPIYTGYGPAVDGPATEEVFIAYVNLALQRAMGDKLKRWGDAYVDLERPIEESLDRRGNPLGVNVHEAYWCVFRIIRPRGSERAKLSLVCDLRAKVIRTKMVLDSLYEQHGVGRALSEADQNRAKREWVGETVIYKQDRKSTCRVVGIRLRFL